MNLRLVGEEILIKLMILFLIGVLIGYYWHFIIEKFKEDRMAEKRKKTPEELQKEIEQKNKTIELLDFAIKQKKEERYDLLQKNIQLRKDNQNLIDLRETTEELQKKAREDGMKIYVPKKKLDQNLE